MNKLEFQPEAERARDGLLATGTVGVLVSLDDDKSEVFMPVNGARIEELDDEQYLGVSTANGVRYYPIKSEDDVTVDDENGKITFSSYGKIYTIRAFEDSDGTWASVLESPVPAETLEERYMAEISTAFSPDAPAADENLYAAVDEETNEVKELVYSTTAGMYTRSYNAWFRIPKDDETLDDLVVYEVDPKFIKIYDMAQGNDDTLFVDDLDKYEVEFRGALTAAAEPECPPATLDIELNIQNRQNAIDNVGYGPLNPQEPNEEFWQEKAEKWSVTPEDAKKSLCGNCGVFIRTTKMLACISAGLQEGDQNADDADAVIDAAELGYCEALDFKCAASRTCDAWVTGGPITDENMERKNG